jgi:hypothetical protein
MSEHCNGDDGDAGTFSSFYGCDKRIAVVFKTWLAKIVDYCKTN